MAIDRATALNCLRYGAMDQVYTEDVRKQLGDAASALQRDEITPRDAMRQAFGARLALHAAYSQGTAFGEDVPRETWKARQANIHAEVNSVIARLRFQGASPTVLGALEGALATGDLKRMARTWYDANTIADTGDLKLATQRTFADLRAGRDIPE